MPSFGATLEFFAYDSEGLIHNGWFTAISAEDGFDEEPILVVMPSDILRWESRPSQQFTNTMVHVLTIGNAAIVEQLRDLRDAIDETDYDGDTNQWRFPAFRVRVAGEWVWGWVDYLDWPVVSDSPRLDYYPPTRAEDELWLLPYLAEVDGVDLGLAARATWETNSQP